MEKNGKALKHASEALQNNFNLVRAAVKHNGMVMQYASKTLQNDREVVLAAVRKSGMALQHASKLELLVLPKTEVGTSLCGLATPAWYMAPGIPVG